MTTLAKNLAEGLDVHFNSKVVHLEKGPDGGWLIGSNPLIFGEKSFKTVVLTCPLPQSLELLTASKIAFDPSLAEIRYAKALVGLFEGVRSSGDWLGRQGFVESPGNGKVASVSDQMAKGVSPVPAWTVTMGPGFSESFFQAEDAVVLEAIADEICESDPHFSFQASQLKRWRFSHPLAIYPRPFIEVADGLILAGDAFGGPSLNGAMLSANAVLEALQKWYRTSEKTEDASRRRPKKLSSFPR